MSLELQLFLFRILIPAVLAAAGGFLFVRHSILLGAFLAGLGIVLSDFLARGILWNPSEWLDWEARYQWQWLVWLLPASFLVLAVSYVQSESDATRTFFLWPALFLFSLAVHYVALFEMESWGDKWELAFHSILIGLIVSVVNIGAIHELNLSGASRWSPLVLLGQLGCAAAIALQSYASLGEWILSSVGIVVGIACVTLAVKADTKPFGGWPFSILVYPLAIAAAVGIALTPFFQSRPLLPLWLHGIVLLLPAVVWFFDVVYGRYWRTWLRVVLAAIVSAAVLGGVIWFGI